MFYRYEFRKAFLPRIPQHKGKDKVKYVCVFLKQISSFLTRQLQRPSPKSQIQCYSVFVFVIEL